MVRILSAQHLTGFITLTLSQGTKWRRMQLGANTSLVKPLLNRENTGNLFVFWLDPFMSTHQGSSI